MSMSDKAGDDLSGPGIPSLERLARGPVAIIECFQEIPCNPCEKACRFGAIRVGELITDLPRIDAEKCTGCGNCISACPGQAIFVAECLKERSRITFPFEYLPLPEPGEKVEAVDRQGRVLGEALVEKVRNPAGFAHTPLVTILVAPDLAMSARSIRLAKK